VALRHRARTGEGQQVEVPQAEALMSLMAIEYLDFQMNDRVREAVANDHRTHAPHNAYRCAGDDRWIAIDVGDDEQWHAACAVLGLAARADDPEFTTADARWRNRRELDRVIEEATSVRDRDALFAGLVEAGVPAGPVQDDHDAFTCPQLRSRDWFEPISRNDLGTSDYPGRIFKLTATALPPRRPPPRLGEANEYVYRELLGYSAERLQGLIDRGLVGTTFSDEALARARGR
jgi:benzylsuccinate CoA-transferase BbsF subunit